MWSKASVFNHTPRWGWITAPQSWCEASVETTRQCGGGAKGNPSRRREGEAHALHKALISGLKGTDCPEKQSRERSTEGSEAEEVSTASCKWGLSPQNWRKGRETSATRGQEPNQERLPPKTKGNPETGSKAGSYKEEAPRAPWTPSLGASHPDSKRLEVLEGGDGPQK